MASSAEKAQIGSLRSELGQMDGKVEKLQFGGLDGIMVRFIVRRGGARAPNPPHATRHTPHARVDAHLRVRELVRTSLVHMCIQTQAHVLSWCA